MAHLVANRQGEVLGPHAILKEDHFPGRPATAPLQKLYMCGHMFADEAPAAMIGKHVRMNKLECQGRRLHCLSHIGLNRWTLPPSREFFACIHPVRRGGACVSCF